MNIKYLKNPKTKDRFYPIIKSDCIIDAFSISNLEIDKLFSDSLLISKNQKGMSYLNLQGLSHYHSKIKDYFNDVISMSISKIDLTGYATEEWIRNQNYLTEHQDISNKVDIEDFQEATHVTSAALNLFHQINSWQNE